MRAVRAPGAGGGTVLPVVRQRPLPARSSSSRSGASSPCCSPTSSATPRWPSTSTRSGSSASIDACFERLVADIESFGGRVDKLLGDAIVALFGAPVAHEDDAERAVRAALRMQETLAASSPRCGDDPPIQMRIGINTGEVLVGTLAGTDYTAMGDVVNTASRLQAMAPPAACSSAPPPRRCARRRSAASPSPTPASAAASGPSSRGWSPARRRPACRPIRCDVPFVGRASERRLLDAAVQLVRDGHSGVVSVVGEAGAGKTRLVDEIISELEDEAIVLRMACAPYGETNVWRPVVDGLSALFGLDPEASDADIEAAVRPRSFELWGLDADDDTARRTSTPSCSCSATASSLDRLDPAGARDAVAGTLTDMLRRDAETRMTVLWIDNLQWAEANLRDLLVHRRALVVRPAVPARDHPAPDPDVAWPPPAERPLVLQVPLGPLSDGRRQLAGARHPRAAAVPTAGDGPSPRSSTAAAATRCSSSSSPRWRPTCDAGSELPGSLRALIAARLDKLPSAQRAIIDNAAVLGTADAIGSLERFAKELGQEFRRGDLDELAADGLLDIEGRWWRFRSAVVREVAYQTLTKRVRAQRHAGVAAVMRAERGAPIDEVAHHAATAAELLAELGNVDGVKPGIVDNAVGALLEAATTALRTGRLETAARHASRALDLHHADPASERDLLLVRAEAEVDQRNFAPAVADAEEVLERRRRRR